MMLDLKFFKDIGYLKGIIRSIILVSYKKMLKFNKNELWSDDRITYASKFPRLVLDENLENACDSCGKCIEICPTSCLFLEGEEGRSPTTFNLSIANCVGCSLCEEICPTEAIAMSESINQFEFTKKQILNKQDLYLG